MSRRDDRRVDNAFRGACASGASTASLANSLNCFLKAYGLAFPAFKSPWLDSSCVLFGGSSGPSPANCIDDRFGEKIRS